MRIMSFDEFKEEVAGKIRQFLPDSFEDADISLHVVSKNNGLELTGLTISKKDSNMAPVIYLESFYEQYSEGTEFDVLLEKIANIRVVNERQKFDMSEILCFEKCKNKIVPRICNLEANSELLKKRVHRELEDLAVTYHVMIEEGEGGEASTAVTQDVLKAWNVTEEEVADAAISNLKHNTVFSTMREVIMGILHEEAADILADIPGDERLYVLSNRSKSFGASAILDDELMKRIDEKIGDFYVLPSSVHEVLLVPVSSGMNPEELVEMVRSVNTECVKQEDKLSDHVYKYDLENGFTMAV